MDNKAIMIEGSNAKQSVNIYRWPVASLAAARPLETTERVCCRLCWAYSVRMWLCVCIWKLRIDMD